MEGNHKEIKANHTFRTELPLGQFIQVLEQLVNSSHHFWSPKLKLSFSVFRLSFLLYALSNVWSNHV